jgi:hypothetical protein
MSEQEIPTEIIVWQNGMVMSFDANGQQIPEYQGRYEDVIKIIPEEYHHLICREQWPGTEPTWQGWIELSYGRKWS